MDGSVDKHLDTGVRAGGHLGTGSPIGAAVVVFLGLNLLVAALAFFTDWLLIGVVRQAQEGKIPPFRQVSELDGWAHLLHVSQIGLMVLTAAIYLKWVSDAVRRAFRHDPTFPHSLAWAQASFFVPFASFYLPAKITNSLVNVARGRVGFARTGTNPSVVAWWTAWVLAGIFGTSSRTLDEAKPTWTAIEDLAWRITVSDLMLLVAAGLAILVIRQSAGLWTRTPTTTPEVA